MRHECENKSRQHETPQEIIRLARANAEQFNPGFPEWLSRNLHIWLRFRDEADRIRRRRDHYSARTILEFIRHESMLYEFGQAEYKINNNSAPDLARLYMLATPNAEGFFALRAGA